jgi:RNA polymerase sigma-70 factor, ECF subfamily
VLADVWPLPSLPPSTPSVTGPAGNDSDEAWLRDFHRGERAALARCYQEYAGTVTWAVGQVLRGVDQETVVQDVFCRLTSEAPLRSNFEGGNFGAWIITVARRQAIDFRRKHEREQPTDPSELPEGQTGPGGTVDSVELRLLVQRFLAVLPPKWEAVFRARFLERLDQRTAARKLGLHRTTLAYQELQVRRLLRRFVLELDR